MVLLLNNAGRFGHQLSQYVTLVAYAFQYNKPIYYPSFDKKYASVFQPVDIPILSQQLSRFRVVFFKILIHVFKLFRVNEIVFLNTYFLINKSKKNELVFQQDIVKLFLSNQKYVVTDYVFNDIPMLLKYRNEIKKKFLLKECNQENILLNKLKTNYEFVIGLHIRRTDFKDFENGQFYFNDDVYIIALNKLIAMLHSNKIAVVICSDEIIDTKKFSNFNIFYDAKSYEEDFFMLKNCDYLISTRSIFTMMANYLGDNKLYQILKKENDFLLSDFLPSDELLSKYYDFSKITNKN